MLGGLLKLGLGGTVGDDTKPVAVGPVLADLEVYLRQALVVLGDHGCFLFYRRKRRVSPASFARAVQLFAREQFAIARE